MVTIDFFESEMQKLCISIPYLQSPTFMGKTMLAKLDDDLRVKISFVTCGVYERYEALQVRIINRTEGEVDSQRFMFRDLLSRGRTLAIEDYGSGPTWGLNKPLQSDYTKIIAALHNYIAMYAPKMEREPGLEMGGQSM